MAAVPVIINGVMMPKGKGAGDKPVPAVFMGYASIAGLEPSHPLPIPEPPPDVVPPDPPPEKPTPDLAVVIKAAPETGGWGLAANDQKLQWYFVPAQSGAMPKQPR